jgi:zinc D-Ala-D-Ala carboxypeptidase
MTWRFAWTGYKRKSKREDDIMSQTYTYFKPEEVVGLEPEFVAKLDLARKAAGIPFRITSGLRTPEKNQSVIGAVPDSAHLKGLAVDLQVETSHEVALILDACKSVGITRRGIYFDKLYRPTHVHVDIDPDKVDEVIFVKQEGSPNVVA